MDKQKARLSCWMKIVLAILITLLITILYILITANIVDKNANRLISIPKVPFTSNMKFCALSEDIYDTDYESGSILLIKDNSSYIVGDKVLIKNKYEDKKEYAVNNYYVVGVISKSSESGMTANLLSYNNEVKDVLPEQVEGKLTSDIKFIGNIYNNMLGLKGYLLFGAIPALILLLIYSIMRLTVLNRVNTCNEQEVLDNTYEAEQIVLEYTNIKTIEELIDQEDNVELVNENHIKDSDSPHISDTTKNRIEKLNKNNTVEIMQRIKEKNKQLEKEFQGENANKQLESTVIEYKQVKEDNSKNNKLCADQIIQLYRDNAVKNKSSDNTQSSDKDKMLNRISKMYYESNIENYD